MSEQEPEILSTETIYDGRKVRLDVHRVRDPDGRETTREVVRHPGSVAVLALRRDGGGTEVLLERNWRYTVGRRVLEIPAGTMDEEGEDAPDCARRELSEETGFRAGSLRRLVSLMPSPGFLTEQITVFVAEDVTVGQAALEAGELIEPVWVAWEQCLRMIRDGEIVDGKTIAAVLSYETFVRRGGG